MRLAEELERTLRRGRRRPLFAAADVPAASMDREALHDVLPHRGPMLLLDGVTGFDDTARRGVGRRVLTQTDPGFDGHFPGDPVYPGVLQVEMVGQLGLLVAMRSAGAVAASVRLVRLLDAVFIDALRPGDELTILAAITQDDGYVVTGAGQILVEGRVGCVCAFEAMGAS